MKSRFHTPRRLTVASIAAAGVFVAVALSGCASSNASSSGGGSTAKPTTAALPADLVSAAEKAAKDAAGGAKLGGTITILGVTSGEEGESLQAAMAPFTTATGVKIKYTGTQDEANVLAAAVKAGNAPDIVDGQGTGLMVQYAKSGDAVPLDDIIGASTFEKDFNKGLLDATTVDGKNYGLWGETDTFQIWYNTKTYKGPTSGSWQDLTSWANQQAAKNDGDAPWCMAMNAGAGSGFPGQSWIENVFVKKYGTAEMKKWADGELSWTSPEVKWAFQEFGKVATSNTLVNGGPQAVVSTPITDYSKGMFSSPQQCQLTLWGNFAAGLVQSQYPDVKVPGDLNFFDVPASDPQYANDLEVGGHVTFAMNTKPATKAFLKYWETAAAQSLIAASGRWTVGNHNVPLSAYPNSAMQSSAKLLYSAENLTPGASSVVSSAVNNAELKGIITYIQDPSKLDSVLESIQAAAQ